MVTLFDPSQINGVLKLIGGTLTGILSLGGNSITNVANGVASTDVAAFGQVTPLFGYRRPNLVYSSTTVVSVETGLDGTSGDAVILFPGGSFRTETSSSRYQCNFAQNAVFTNATLGSNQGGLRTGSQTANTWYAMYAVKVTTFAANWVLVADTVMPTQANFATLNTNFGTNSWVYLGVIPNGNGISANNVVTKFVQIGNMTLFQNSFPNTSIQPGSRNSQGAIYESTSGASIISWTYSPGGTVGVNIPAQLTGVQWQYIGNSSTNQIFGGNSNITISSTDQIFIALPDMSGVWTAARIWLPTIDGVGMYSGAGASAMTILLVGYIDTVLGVGSNPLM